MFLVNRATAARAVQKLESEGYVQRVQDLQDKRVLRVYLTEAGRKLQEVVMKLSTKRREELFAGFSDEEQATFLRLLSKMVDNVCEEKWQ
ncbi:DNA-binding MarR family transcriptional regulator [Methanohalophilus levihalophilus]|nr:DNA-binding MarR family transcriptional regulator [Methanohalophilus levihalophilus]